jgi:hypothetical protein
MAPTGFTGSCPCCFHGYVEEYTCDNCGREFCKDCGGIKKGELSTGVMACICAPTTLGEMMEKFKKPHERAPE